jgi:ABC-type bacteriocin/lantibiotic exporter with double-glycine peptidase domain
MTQKPTSPFHRLWRIIRAERQEVRSIYAFAIFQGLMNLSLPLGVQSIINFLQAGQLSTSWYMLVLFVLAGILFAGLLQIKQLAVTETIEQRLFANASFSYAERLPRLSLEALRGRYMPEVLNRFFEVVTVQKGISKLLLDFSAAIIQVFFGILLLSLYNSAFAIMGILLVAVLYLIFKFTGRVGLETSMKESNNKFRVAYWLQEVGRTLSSFKLAGASALPLNKVDRLTGEYLDSRNRHFRVLIMQYKALIAFKVLLSATLIILGSVLVIRKEINIGQFVAAEIIVLLLISSVEKIILNMSTVYDVLTALDKLEHVSELPTERQDGDEVPTDKTANGVAVSVKNLTYRFEPNEPPAIDDVSLEINSGELVCVKGNNASGKTTLLKLLAGFYEKYSGTIAYNHMPLGNLKLASLRAMVGENFTEQEIFKGTIVENITCGIDTVSMEEVLDVCNKAGLASYIERLPLGYNTKLKPGGMGLPGSIKRKLMLARSFAGKPRLMLIEDTLTAQSFQERQNFFDMLFNQCKGITTVIVSNDDEVAKRCDKVYTLRNGKLIEQ